MSKALDGFELFYEEIMPPKWQLKKRSTKKLKNSKKQVVSSY